MNTDNKSTFDKIELDLRDTIFSMQHELNVICDQLERFDSQSAESKFRELEHIFKYACELSNKCAELDE